MKSSNPMAPKAMNIRKIPQFLRQRFKELCAREGVTMEEKAIELIQSAVYSQESSWAVTHRSQVT